MLLVVACLPAPVELTEDEKAAIVSRVTAAVEAYWNSWIQLDVDLALTHFHDTPETGFAWEGGAVRGLETMREEWERAFEGFVSQTVTIANRQVTVLASNIVYVSETGTYSLSDSSGTSTPEFQFAQTTVWVHRDGEWKIQTGHVSTATLMQRPFCISYHGGGHAPYPLLVGDGRFDSLSAGYG
jgi:hypothetical protein